jgi:hypothetical protein
VRNYDPDVVATFEIYFKHLPEGFPELFLAIIESLRTIVWYTKTPMGIKTIRGAVKKLFEENGLDPQDYSNKPGRTTHITQMAAAGVPAEVGMLVTGEFVSFVCFFWYEYFTYFCVGPGFDFHFVQGMQVQRVMLAMIGAKKLKLELHSDVQQMVRLPIWMP